MTDDTKDWPEFLQRAVDETLAAVATQRRRRANLMEVRMIAHAIAKRLDAEVEAATFMSDDDDLGRSITEADANAMLDAALRKSRDGADDA